jgi:uncharacterized protein YjbI with pentapeptide repeats
MSKSKRTAKSNRKRPPPLSVGLDFAHADLSNSNWSNYDFRFVWLFCADLSTCSLRRAQLGYIREASLRGSDLRGARFHLAGLTGTDFSGARLAGASFRECTYVRNQPPIGLTTDILSRCIAVTDAEAATAAPGFNLIMTGHLTMV